MEVTAPPPTSAGAPRSTGASTARWRGGSSAYSPLLRSPMDTLSSSEGNDFQTKLL